jgi:beta-galactosidase
MPELAELKKDMAVLKRKGFNLIKLQEHWMLDEPAEGRYDFSRYEELIAEAARLDLGVYLGLTCEQAPAWLYRKHADCRMVGRNGLPIAYEAPNTLPADGKPGPCFDHPGARADMLRFIRALVACLGRFENLVIWNTWQEIGYWAEGLVGDSVCFCPHTLAAYRDWLKQTHGDLDALNRTWNARYAEWIDILPNRAPGGVQPCGPDLSWKYFMENIQIGRVLKVRADAIRAADPLNRPVFAHKGGPVIGSSQDWTYARQQDFLGSSCYPAWGSGQPWDDVQQKKPIAQWDALRAELWNAVALQYDYIRSANPPGVPTWAAEFQGGPVSVGFHKGRIPQPADIRRWMLSAIGAGVSAISFWNTRAEIMPRETNGFGLLDSVGDSTARLDEAGRIGKALQRFPDLFGRPTRPPARVALLIDEDNFQFCSLYTPGGEHEAYSVRGWHRILWDAGIPVDFIDPRFLTADEMNGYAIIILPFLLAPSEHTVAALTAYVAQGGHVISDAAPGRNSPQGFCLRGEMHPAWMKLFGCVPEDFTLVREPDGPSRWSFPERTWGEYREACFLEGLGPCAEQKLRANLYVQSFKLKGGAPFLKINDQIAGVTHQTGKGTTWILGTFAGHNGTAHCDAASRKLIAGLLDRCGVRPEHTGALLLQKRVTPTAEAWCFTNPTAGLVEEAVDLKAWKQVEDLVGEPVQRKGQTVMLKVAPMDVRVLIVSA